MGLRDNVTNGMGKKRTHFVKTTIIITTASKVVMITVLVFVLCPRGGSLYFGLKI